jgi:multidrug efflux pump subunit AcrB
MYKFFIERPIVSMVISIIMVIVGAVAALSLPLLNSPTLPIHKFRLWPPMSAQMR